MAAETLEQQVDRMLLERGVTSEESEPYAHDFGPEKKGTVVKLHGDEIYAPEGEPPLYVFTLEELDRLLIRTDPVAAVDAAVERCAEEFSGWEPGDEPTTSEREKVKRDVIAALRIDDPAMPEIG